MFLRMSKTFYTWTNGQMCQPCYFYLFFNEQKEDKQRTAQDKVDVTSQKLWYYSYKERGCDSCCQVN